MPKVKTYTQKFRNEWKRKSEFKGWLEEVKNDFSRAYYSVCKCTITAKYSDLTVRSSSKKHTNAVKTPVPEITKFW